MATLRTPNIFAAKGPVTTPEDLAALDASGMGSLRRGFQTGLIGNDITGLAADEASLRADGRMPEADALRQQIGTLQRRQAVYAPEVQDVTKVNSLGTGLDWLGGAVGQGGASMMEPIALTTGLTAAGNVIGAIPTPLTRGIGAGLRAAGPLAAYGVNARHLKGEVYNGMAEDPEIMRNHSAQELNTKANVYGGLAGIADTALPAMLGRQLGGSGLGKGLLKNGGLRLGGQLAGEGATEAAQDYGSQQLRGDLNPNRDTSGDENSLINSFAGGMAGVAPLAGAAHLADTGFRRVGDGVERVAAKAGDVVDLAADSEIGKKAKGWLDKGKAKVVDLASDDEGNITPDSVKSAFKEATSGLRKPNGISTDEQAILRGDVPADLQDKTDTPEFEAWATKSHRERTSAVLDHLGRMADANDDDHANTLYGEIAEAKTPAEQDAAVGRASQYILDNNELADQLSSAEAWGKIVGAAGKAAGKGAASAGKVAANFGKSMWAGMKEGAKKNEQSWTPTDVEAHQGEGKAAADNFFTRQAAMKKSADRAQLMGEYLAATAKAEMPRYSAHRVGAEHMPEFMRSVGREIADIADSWGLSGGDVKAEKKGQQFDNLKLNLNRVVNSIRVAYGKDKAGEIIDQLHSMIPDARVNPLFDFMRSELETQLKPGGAEHTRQVRDEAAQAVLAKIPQDKEAALMSQGITLRDPETRAMLLKNLETLARGTTEKDPRTGQRKQIDSLTLRNVRQGLNRMLGQQTVNDMMEVLGAGKEDAQNFEEIVDDRGAHEEMDEGYTLDDDGNPVDAASTTSYDKNTAERKVAKNGGPRLYGFHSTGNIRTGSQNKNPFAGERRVSKENLQKWQDENRQRASEGLEQLPDPRGLPKLFKRGQRLSEAMGGGSATEQKIATMSKALKQDQTPENAMRILKEEGNEKAAKALAGLAEKAKAGDEAAQAKLKEGLDAFFVNRAGGWSFGVKSAHEVMEETNIQPAKRLSMFREYLVNDGKFAQAKQVGNMLLDITEVRQKAREQGIDPKDVTNRRTTSGERKRIVAAMNDYFKTHEVVVGEQLSDRDPMKLTEPEVLDMARQAQKVLDKARMPENKDRANELLSAANLLTFKSDLSKHKDRELTIPVGALVYWVKRQKGLSTVADLEGTKDMSNRNANQEYLEAVMEGVAAMVGTGMVDGWPYKVNAKGARESFSQGIPASLMLATTTYGGMRYGEKQNPKIGKPGASPGQHSDEYVFAQANPDKSADEVRALMAKIREEKGTKGYALALARAERKAKIKSDEDGHINVALDQKRQEDYFTAEPLEVVEPTTDNPNFYAPGTAKGDKQRVAARKGGVKSTAEMGPLENRRNGEPDMHARDVTARQRVRRDGKTVADPKTQNPNKTPLDFFPRQKPGEQPDEFADVLGRTKRGGESVYSLTKADLDIERPVDAVDKAGERARPIVEALTQNYAEGAEMVRSRLAAAERPAYSQDKNAATGGAHYAYPLAEALSNDNLQTYDLGPSEAKELVALRAQLAGVIKGLKADVKVKLTRMLAPDEQVFSTTVDRILNKIAAEGKAEVAPAQLGKPQSQLSGAPPNGMPSTEAQRQEARDYIAKVLGKEVRVAFEDAMKHSGEWLDAENLIKISTTSAAGTLQTAYHEALHAFFSKYVKNAPDTFKVLKTLAEDKVIVDRVRALLDGFPAAQAQLASGEERLAYIYQFWAAGKLDLTPSKALNWFQALRKLVKRVLGMVKDSERAVALFEALHAGKLSDPSAAGQVIAKELAKGTWTKAQLAKMDGLVQWVAGKTMPSEVVLTSSVSARARALALELYTNPADAKAGGAEEGYMNAKMRHAKQYSNRFKNEIIADLSDRDLVDMERYMQAETELADIPYQPVRKAVMQLRQLNRRFYRYMTEERGMKLGDLGPKYYPRVWNKGALIEKQADFIDMLHTHYATVLEDGSKNSKGKLTTDDVAHRIYDAILTAGEVMNKTGPQRDDGVLTPYFMSQRVRDLAWLKPEHTEPFQEKNIVKTVTTYFHDGARAAEYSTRFGNEGEHLDRAMREIRGELVDHAQGKFKNKADRKKWVDRQMRDVHDAVAAMEGTIGKDISPRMRSINSWMVAYQNLRLLPLMLFSSMVDPMAMVGRGATMKDAYDAYLRGMGEVFRSWGNVFRDDPKKAPADRWQTLAEASGIVDAALFATHVSDEYASVYMSGRAKKVNDLLFKLNGMEAWDRGMRIAATKSAALFIARHKALPDTHSERWLSELGLTPGDIHLDDQGFLITDKNDLMNSQGITKEEAERQASRMHYALSRWVQGAVLSPNAAHRPAWGSDPHYSMFFHLKQFTYSFHQTVLKRAVNELNYGNLAPLGTFAWYIPVMIASDVTKGLIQGAGELPTHLKGMDPAQWIAHGAERAGLLGLGAIGVDASHDVASLGGPAVEQIIDAFGSPARNTAVNALPLHGLYAEALR